MAACRYVISKLRGLASCNDLDNPAALDTCHHLDLAAAFVRGKLPDAPDLPRRRVGPLRRGRPGCAFTIQADQRPAARAAASSASCVAWPRPTCSTSAAAGASSSGRCSTPSPALPVIAIDRRPDRVADLQAVSRRRRRAAVPPPWTLTRLTCRRRRRRGHVPGGAGTPRPARAGAVAEAVRVARRFVVVSVPSQAGRQPRAHPPVRRGSRCRRCSARPASTGSASSTCSNHIVAVARGGRRMIDLHKYPRTQHIEGSRLQPGDEDLDSVPFAELAGRYLVVEEKLDGANAGAAASTPTARCWLQSRGHFLTGGVREKHFNLFKQWASAHAGALCERLGDRYVLYGEWLYAKHTIFYDRLPHYFLEFDVLDTRDGRRSSRPPAGGSCSPGLPVASVPVLYEGPARRSDDLLALVGPSLYKGPTGGDRLDEPCARAGPRPRSRSGTRPTPPT